MEISICLCVAAGVREKSIPTEITPLLKFSLKFCSVPGIIQNPELQCSDNTETLLSVFWIKTTWAFPFYFEVLSIQGLRRRYIPVYVQNREDESEARKHRAFKCPTQGRAFEGSPSGFCSCKLTCWHVPSSHSGALMEHDIPAENNPSGQGFLVGEADSQPLRSR